MPIRMQPSEKVSYSPRTKCVNSARRICRLTDIENIRARLEERSEVLGRVRVHVRGTDRRRVAIESEDGSVLARARRAENMSADPR